MKTLSAVSVLALATAMMMPVAAFADSTPGWYVSGGVGGMYTPDGITKPPAAAGSRKNLVYDLGGSVNGAGGYEFDNGLRLEGELWYSDTGLYKIKNATGPHNGDLGNTDLFANALYDFKTGTMFTPYVGLGVGIDFADANHEATFSNGSALNGGDTQLAYQAIGGIAAQLDPNWSVSADYRYVASTEPKYAVTSGGGARTDNESHNVVLSVRYSFGEPAALPPTHKTMAPRPAAAAAMKPAVAPVQQSYMVFFDFNKSDLTPEAKNIIAKAAQDYQSGNSVKTIIVTGHTDTVGTDKYNKGLSARRAAAVKAEFESLGVKADVVRTHAAGKGGLMVPTADGVREAQNRRAEITFGSMASAPASDATAAPAPVKKHHKKKAVATPAPAAQ